MRNIIPGYCLIWMICFLQISCLYAQQASSPGGFRHFRVAHGLPSSEIYKVIQDSKGYIWMTTDAGVCRYNGTDFKTFTIKDGLPENTAFKIIEDAFGKIWVQTFSGALCYFNGQRFIPIQGNDYLKKAFNFGQRLSFSLSSSSKGEIITGGLTTAACMVFSPENNFVAPRLLSLKPNNKSLRVIYSTPDRQLNCYSDFNNIHLNLLTFFHNGKEISIPVTDQSLIQDNNRMLLTKDNRILFSVDKLLYILDENGKFDTIRIPASILGINEDEEQNIWISTRNNGAYCFKKGDLHSIPDNYLFGKTLGCVLQDNEGGYWFSTIGDGLYYLSTLSFHYLTPLEGLPEQAVLSLAPFESHSVVMGLPNSKVVIFSPNDDVKIREYRYLKSPHLSVEVVMNWNGMLVYQPDNNLIFLKDGKELKKHNLIIHKKGYNVNPVNGQYLFFSHSSLTWTDNQLNVVNTERTKVRFLTVYYDHQGQLWLGALNGLWKYGKDGPQFWTQSNSGKSVEVRVDAIQEDKNGNLWIGTRGEGVFILSGDSLFHADESSGLAGNSCRSITVDDDGNIWIGTNNGLSKVVKFNSLNGSCSFRNFSTSDGLLTDEIKLLLFHDHKIWIGGNEGLCWVDYKEIEKKRGGPPIYFKSITYGDEQCISDSIYRFSYSDDILRFYFEGVYFRNPEDLSFKYRLKGTSEDWLFTKNRELSFAGLRPGKYTLEIYAVNADGNSSTKPISFSFIIKTPFWLSWWFYIVIGIVSGILIWMIALNRQRKVRQLAEARKDQEKRMAELRLSALRAQMNPHFIFNAINSIQHFVLRNNSEQAYNYLSKFSKLIRLVLDHTRSDKVDLNEEIHLLNLYVELEKLRFEQPFDFDLKIDPEVKEHFVKIPGMLIQPFVENAIWHGLLPLKDRPAKLYVSFQRRDSGLLIIIEDNGIGRTASMNNKDDHGRRSYGLSFTRERLNNVLFNNSDSKATLDIVDLKDNNGNATGTRVIITLPEMFEDDTK